MPVDPLTNAAFDELGKALNKNAKDIKASTQNIRETQWNEVAQGTQLLGSLAESLKVSGPATSVLLGKVIEATSQERVDSMTSLVNLINSPAFSTAIDGLSSLINNLFRDIQIYSAILQQIQNLTLPDWLIVLLGLNRNINDYRPGRDPTTGQPYVPTGGVGIHVGLL